MENSYKEPIVGEFAIVCDEDTETALVALYYEFVKGDVDYPHETSAGCFKHAYLLESTEQFKEFIKHVKY